MSGNTVTNLIHRKEANKGEKVNVILSEISFIAEEIRECSNCNIYRTAQCTNRRGCKYRCQTGSKKCSNSLQRNLTGLHTLNNTGFKSKINNCTGQMSSISQLSGCIRISICNVFHYPCRNKIFHCCTGRSIFNDIHKVKICSRQSHR